VASSPSKFFGAILVKFDKVWAKIKILHPQKHSISGYVNTGNICFDKRILEILFLKIFIKNLSI